MNLSRVIVGLAVGLASCETSAPVGGGASLALDAGIDAREPDQDGGSLTCGQAASLAPNQVSGSSPYGSLIMGVESTSFANGCGAMSMSISYVSVQEDDYRFTASFALPELTVPVGQPAYSAPGNYPITLSTSVCDLSGTNCTAHEVGGTVDIQVLIDDVNVDPNTDLTIDVEGAGWDISALTIDGASCPWVWSPC